MFLTHSWYNFELNEPSCVIYVHLLSLKNLHMLFCYGYFVIGYLFGFCRIAELICNKMSGSSEIILYYSEMQLELSEIDLNYLKLIWKLLKLTWIIWNSLGNFWNSLEKGVVIRHKIYILYISSELIQLDHLEYFIIPIRSYTGPVFGSYYIAIMPTRNVRLYAQLYNLNCSISSFVDNVQNFCRTRYRL